MTATVRTYLIVIQQIVGDEHSWTTTYSREGTLFADRAKAIAHGIKELGHDDFNIATLDGGRLVAFGWGEDDFGPEDGYDLAEIARHLCLPPPSGDSDEAGKPMSATYLHFDGMAWPNPQDPAEVEHALRYGTPTREQLLVAASFVAAFKQLVEDSPAVRDRKVDGIRWEVADAAALEEAGQR